MDTITHPSTIPTSTSRRPGERMLRGALLADLAFSTPWVAAAILGAGALEEPLGVPARISLVVGLALLPGLVLFYVFYRRTEPRANEGMLAGAGNVALGLGLTIAGVVTPDLTDLGRVVVIGSGLIVLDLAAFELWGAAKLRRDR